MILLDTNIVSALMRPIVDPAVVTYIDAQPTDGLFMSCVSEVEVRYGLMHLPAGRRRNALTVAFDELMEGWFKGHTVVFDSVCAAACADIRVRRASVGRPIAVTDAMIAATALAHGATVATRNVADFERCGIAVENPWDAI